MALQLSYLLSLLLLVLLLPYSTTAQASSNQSLGSSLIAQENGFYWAYPSGDFAFGFQQIGNGGYLLAHCLPRLDTGNFVLASQDSSHLWQSFDHPIDTMLPTQTMSMGSKLVAHYSERNYSNGRFQSALKIDGNLVLQTLAFPIDWSNTDYWSSGAIGSGFQVVFNESGTIYLTATNGSILTTISSNSISK
ncbi:hypothetical protein SO802_019532 [Lithocarpus litseifolius]|uniref:Bulb-type lectin domain-containing protein n=1 Tax=Lithocarpus litseifolius TaxID=425828 RepID=A0AAW2CRV1_9ROSI